MKAYLKLTSLLLALLLALKALPLELKDLSQKELNQFRQVAYKLVFQ